MPLTSRRPRAGTTLVELLVAIALLAVIGAAASSAIRMQLGVHRRVGARVAASAQLREALAPLVSDLALLSAEAGDVPDGGATDTTLDLRATVAAGHVCGASPLDARTAWLALPMVRGRGISAGDSLWTYAGRAGWRPHRVDAASEAGAPAPAPCAETALATQIVRVSLDTLSAPLPEGAPVRASRRVRYSLYRGSDGATWLGLREWTLSLGGLATVQPVAGPFDARSSGFAYLDHAGNVLDVPVVASRQIAAVRIRLSSPPRGDIPPRSDSLLVLLRNGG